MRSARDSRLRAGMSLSEAARILRLTPGYLRHIEGGRSLVPKGLLTRMATLYGARQDEIQPVADRSPEGKGTPPPARRTAGGGDAHPRSASGTRSGKGSTTREVR